MKKGFTLIELLAVIVILTIIALIASPIILNIVDSSKRSAEKRSIESYKDAVALAVTSYAMNNPDKLTEEYYTKDDGKILYRKSDNSPVENLIIDYSGKTVICDSISINSSGIITYGNFNSIENVQNDKLCRRISNIANEVSVGDKYTCNVDGTNSYDFYVIGYTDNEINLIMNENLPNSNIQNSDLTQIHAEIENKTSNWSTKIAYPRLIKYEELVQLIEPNFTNSIIENGGFNADAFREISRLPFEQGLLPEWLYENSSQNGYWVETASKSGPYFEDYEKNNYPPYASLELTDEEKNIINATTEEIGKGCIVQRYVNNIDNCNIRIVITIPANEQDAQIDSDSTIIIIPQPEVSSN